MADLTEFSKVRISHSIIEICSEAPRYKVAGSGCQESRAKPRPGCTDFHAYRQAPGTFFRVQDVFQQVQTCGSEFHCQLGLGCEHCGSRMAELLTWPGFSHIFCLATEGPRKGFFDLTRSCVLDTYHTSCLPPPPKAVWRNSPVFPTKQPCRMVMPSSSSTNNNTFHQIKDAT